MKTITKYGRIQLDFNPGIKVDFVKYIAPDGTCDEGPVFEEMPAKLVYDRHGYETVETFGDPHPAARYTPEQVGKYLWKAYCEDTIVEEGEFEVTQSSNRGYVQVSSKDSRYFAYSDGDAFVPIGLNLVGADYYSLPRGGEHFERTKHSATLGCISYERWFRQLAENGGNYARLWLSHHYFEARTETPGVHDLTPFARLDQVVSLAREYGIHLKLCFEHFRTFTRYDYYFNRIIRDPETGEALKDVEKWYMDEKWNKLWLLDIAPYINRYWNDPVVFAWELWNENECVDAKFEAVLDWTGRMLTEVKKRSPKNLATNSLGSFDSEGKQKVQDGFRDLEEMDFQQVHRYLDQGSSIKIVQEDGVEFSVDAVNRSRRPDKPVLLAETGAVNDWHTGPFRFYGNDHLGLIFHDVTYPAFFGGAAGTGQIWHWTEYVEPKNLWKYFKPFKAMLNGVKVDEENFKCADYSTSTSWVLVLEGDKHLLIFVRNRKDRWDYVLRDGIEAPLIENLTISAGAECESAAFWLCGENPGPVWSDESGIHLPPFNHGCVIRVQKK